MKRVKSFSRADAIAAALSIVIVAIALSAVLYSSRTATAAPSNTPVAIRVLLKDAAGARAWSREARYAKEAAGIAAPEATKFRGRERIRQEAIHKLNSLALEAAKPAQRALTKKIEALGGRVTEALPVPSALQVQIDADKIDLVRELPGVAEVALAQREYLASDPYGSGVSTWHDAGCTGAGGTDTCPTTSAPSAATGPANDASGTGPDLVVDDSGINCHSWAFTGGPTPSLGRTPSIVRPPKTSPCYPAAGYNPDDNGSTHGSTIAGTIAIKDPDHRGIAPGVDKIYDPGKATQCDSGISWLLGFSTRIYWPAYPDVCPNTVSPGVSDIPEAWNMSYTYQDFLHQDYSDVYDGIADALVSQYGIAISAAAGNAGWHHPQPPQGEAVLSCYDTEGYNGANCQYRIGHPCAAYNVLCLGSSTSTNATSRDSDDSRIYFSSVGPTVGGRKKPDLVSPDSYTCPRSGYSGAPRTDYDSAYGRAPNGGNCGNGTSFSAPHGTAAELLLAGVGITSPAAQRAILINSAAPITSALDGGVQQYWRPDVGWGELDLDAAYKQRGDWISGALPGGGTNNARFYRATGQAAADRSTLTWQRRVNASWDSSGYWQSWANQVAPVSDLNLYQITTGGSDNDKDVCGGSTTCGVDSSENSDACPGYVPPALNDPSNQYSGYTTNTVANSVCTLRTGPPPTQVSDGTGAVDGWKTTGDAQDPTEQVRAKNAGSSILKVEVTGDVAGAVAEPYALASTVPLVPLKTPTLDADAPIASVVQPAAGQAFNVSANAKSNSSGTDLVDGLDLASGQLTINLPAGVTCTSCADQSAAGRTLAVGTIAAGASVNGGWTVATLQDGSFPITFTVRGQRFGTTFETTSAPTSVTTDSQVPSLSLTTPSGWQGASTNSVSWTSSDAISSVARVEVESSTDGGGTWASRYDGDSSASAAEVAGGEDATVLVRARATDSAGNASAWQTGSWKIDADPPTLDISAPPSVFVGEAARVRIVARNVGSPLTTKYRVNGNAAADVSGDSVTIALLRSATNVEVTSTDSLGRGVTKSVTIATVQRATSATLTVVPISRKKARRAKKRALSISITPAIDGSVTVWLACKKAHARRKKNSQADGKVVSGRARLNVPAHLGRCSTDLEFRPSDSAAYLRLRQTGKLKL